MIIKSECFHQIFNVIRNCQLKSPFFIDDAGLKQRNDVFYCVFFADDVVEISQFLCNPNSDILILVFQQRAEDWNAVFCDFLFIDCFEICYNRIDQCKFDSWRGVFR